MATSTETTPFSANHTTCSSGAMPAPPAQQNQPAQPPLNWSYFKSEFSDKPEDDAEAHLLSTNDWMETHNFPEAVKVQRFCLILMGEARL